MIRDRLPGCAADERQLLGGLVLFPGDFAAVAQLVSPADFSVPDYSALFAAMSALHEQGQLYEALTLRDLDVLDIEVPTAAGNLQYYAWRIADAAGRRRVIEAATAIAALGLEFHGDAGELAEAARQRIAAAARPDLAAA